MTTEGLARGTALCDCNQADHEGRLIAVTGGPGAGKTAVLAVARQLFCSHVTIVPEAATILFGGGFWRGPSPAARQAAQRAIFTVQRELERILQDDRLAAIGLCDRGTVDGAAYWPGDPDDFFRQMGTTRGAELKRYGAVVHLRTPRPESYVKTNPSRIESATEAAAIDERILAAWRGHPKRVIVEASDAFEDKIAATLRVIRDLLPPCCGRRLASA